MKLYRRKPTYATAMPVHRNEGFVEELEWAVQACDDSGKPLSTHFEFVSEQQFKELYEPFRVRPKTKTVKRNGPPKKPKTPKEEKLQTVNLKDVS